MRIWRDEKQGLAVPPPVPVDEPISRDRPPADYDDDRAQPLTTTRLRLGAGIGAPDTVVVEVIAREGLAREVLLDRAVPLLARARRLLDKYAEPSSTLTGPHRFRCARLADDITDLIGHSTTDAPPAPELEAVLAEGTPSRLTYDQLRELPADIVCQLPEDALPLTVVPDQRDLPGRTLDEVTGWGELTGQEYAYIRYGRPMSGDPLTRTEAEAWAARVPGETPAERTARHERINEALERMGVEVIPPCPMGPYAESSDPAAPEKDEEVAAPARCDGSMVHYFGKPGTAAAGRFDAAGHPPNCPAHREPLHDGPGPDDDDAEMFRRGWKAGWGAGRKSTEPAAPVEETSDARRARLDREAREAQKAYAAAVQAADAAWREVGGRP